MKSTLTVPTEVFYNPSASFAASWYPRSRTGTRRKTTTRSAVILEPDSRKQEVICSVIFVLCLLFSIAICLGQLAVS